VYKRCDVIISWKIDVWQLWHISELVYPEYCDRNISEVGIIRYVLLWLPYSHTTYPVL